MASAFSWPATSPVIVSRQVARALQRRALASPKRLDPALKAGWKLLASAPTASAQAS